MTTTNRLRRLRLAAALAVLALPLAACVPALDGGPVQSAVTVVDQTVTLAGTATDALAALRSCPATAGTASRYEQELTPLLTTVSGLRTRARNAEADATYLAGQLAHKRDFLDQLESHKTSLDAARILANIDEYGLGQVAFSYDDGERGLIRSYAEAIQRWMAGFPGIYANHGESFSDHDPDNRAGNLAAALASLIGKLDGDASSGSIHDALATVQARLNRFYSHLSSEARRLTQEADVLQSRHANAVSTVETIGREAEQVRSDLQRIYADMRTELDNNSCTVPPLSPVEANLTIYWYSSP